MVISSKDWDAYIAKLSALSAKAGDEMQKFINKNGFITESDFANNRNMLIRYAYALIVKYGDGSAELSAEMFDAVSALSGINTTAELASTPEYEDVARAINGSLKQSPTGLKIADTVSRQVKMAGVDTTMNNAIKSGCEVAWITRGDTCAFCITLASRGWQRASKQLLKNGHAEHVHGNCDCTYAVRYNSSDTVEGYNAEEYLEEYNSYPGNSQEKINAMRRKLDAQNRDKINKQKRIAYAKRKEASE